MKLRCVPTYLGKTQAWPPSTPSDRCVQREVTSETSDIKKVDFLFKLHTDWNEHGSENHQQNLPCNRPPITKCYCYIYSMMSNINFTSTSCPIDTTHNRKEARTHTHRERERDRDSDSASKQETECHMAFNLIMPYS